MSLLLAARLVIRRPVGPELQQINVLFQCGGFTLSSFCAMGVYTDSGFCRVICLLFVIDRFLIEVVKLQSKVTFVLFAVGSQD
jgi:hypothetical protein